MTHTPTCIIVTGRPGSGKTTLARLLAEQLWMPMVSRDQIKEGYVNTFGVRHDQLPPEANAIVTRTFFELVNRHLDASVSVLIEAAFQHGVWSQHISGILERARVQLVLCDAGAELAAKRHLQRGLDEPRREFYHGDARVAHYRTTGEFLPPGEYAEPDLGVPTIRVRSVSGYEPSVAEIVRLITDTSATSTP